MRELLQQALDALESVYSRKPLRDLDETICALRSALAAPMPEPVAYGMQDEHGVFVDAISPEEQHRYPGEYKTPLYAAPPAAPAVPLTNDQIMAIFSQSAGYGRDDFFSFARAIEKAHGIGGGK